MLPDRPGLGYPVGRSIPAVPAVIISECAVLKRGKWHAFAGLNDAVPSAPAATGTDDGRPEPRGWMGARNPAALTAGDDRLPLPLNSPLAGRRPGTGWCPGTRVVPWPGPGRAKRLPPHGHLLERPGVAVGVAEGDERAPRLNVNVAGLHAVRKELLAGGLDIRHDDLHTLLRARRHLGNPRPHDHRARRSGRGELHEPQVVRHLIVVVSVEPDLFGVERLGAVDVGHRYGHELDLPVHTWQRTPGAGQSPREPAWPVRTRCRK